MYRIWYTPLVGKKSKALTGIDAQSEAPKNRANGFQQSSLVRRLAENLCGIG
jgi:hypothetical protein